MRTLEAAWRKDGSPGTEVEGGAAPWLQRASGKRHFLRLWGDKGQGQHCFLGGVGRRGRMTSWPAQVSRRFILENREWVSLVHGGT